MDEPRTSRRTNARVIAAAIGAAIGAATLSVSPARAQPIEAAPPAAPPAVNATPQEPAKRASEAEIEAARPPPLNVEYVQYGVAIAAELSIDPGETCPEQKAKGSIVPCIVGSGGGLVVRGGYRSPGPWYIGGAYEFVKMDSGNLYRLGIFQQIRGEMRYQPDTGYRASPYATWGLGAIAYGNEWGIETGGAVVFAGIGLEEEVSRTAVLGLAMVYRPTVIAGWTDTAGHVRRTGIAQFLGVELVLEVRGEVGRR